MEQQNNPQKPEFMKAYNQSKVINNFQTNCQFCKDLGFELLRGTSVPENNEVLKLSMAGLEEFIVLLKDKISEAEKK